MGQGSSSLGSVLSFGHGPDSTGARFRNNAPAVSSGGPIWSEHDHGPYSRRQIPTNKRVVIALRYIHGIGPVNAVEICDKVGIDTPAASTSSPTPKILQIREAIDRDYMVEGDLRRETAMNIKRLMDLGCYRGLRHARACRSAASAPTPTPAPARASPGDRRQEEVRMAIGSRGIDRLPTAHFRLHTIPAPGITGAPEGEAQWPRTPPAYAAGKRRTSHRASFT